MDGINGAQKIFSLRSKSVDKEKTTSRVDLIFQSVFWVSFVLWRCWLGIRMQAAHNEISANYPPKMLFQNT